MMLPGAVGASGEDKALCTSAGHHLHGTSLTLPRALYAFCGTDLCYAGTRILRNPRYSRVLYDQVDAVQQIVFNTVFTKLLVGEGGIPGTSYCILLRARYEIPDTDVHTDLVPRTEGAGVCDIGTESYHIPRWY